MELYGIKTPIIKSGDNIVEILVRSMEEIDFELEDGDIIVLAESAVATAESRVIYLADIKPSEKAIALGEQYSIDPREMELILQESDRIIGGIQGFVLTLKNGFLSPNAGIDTSNAPEEHVVLLPENPDKSAKEIRRKTKDLYGKLLRVTRKAVADNIVSAAQILMGEANESVPGVVMRNTPVEIKDAEGIPTISPEECLYFGIFYNRRDL
jgi:F420-0:gamma-glutamyl ligase